MNTPNTQPQYRVYAAGTPLAQARGVVIMLHGRGSSPGDILSLGSALQQDDLAYLAPEAPGGQWYPFRFMEPIERNEPGITNAMLNIDALITTLAQQGFDHKHIVLLGFSQGACLAVEYAARHAQRYGGIVGLSGGLIGPEGTPRDYAGSMDGTPVFLGCSDVDAHIPLHRVRETTEIFKRLGANVTERIYPRMGHIVNEDEIEHVQNLLDALPPR